MEINGFAYLSDLKSAGDLGIRREDSPKKEGFEDILSVFFQNPEVSWEDCGKVEMKGQVNSEVERELADLRVVLQDFLKKGEKLELHGSPLYKKLRRLLSKIDYILSKLRVAGTNDSLVIGQELLLQVSQDLIEVIRYLEDGAKSGWEGIGGKNLVNDFTDRLLVDFRIDPHLQGGGDQNRRKLAGDEGSSLALKDRIERKHPFFRESMSVESHKKRMGNLLITPNITDDEIRKIKEFLKRLNTMLSVSRKGMETGVNRKGRMKLKDKGDLHEIVRGESGQKGEHMSHTTGGVGAHLLNKEGKRREVRQNQDVPNRVFGIKVGSLYEKGNGLARINRTERPIPLAKGWGEMIGRVVGTVRHLVSMNKIPGGMRVRLHPPELGSLRIDVKLEGEALVVQLQAEKGSAHNLIKSHLTEIRDQLLDLGQFQDVKVQILPGQNVFGDGSSEFSHWQGTRRRFNQERPEGKKKEEIFPELFSEIINAVA